MLYYIYTYMLIYVYIYIYIYTVGLNKAVFCLSFVFVGPVKVQQARELDTTRFRV